MEVQVQEKKKKKGGIAVARSSNNTVQRSFFDPSLLKGTRERERERERVKLNQRITENSICPNVNSEDSL
jgi:hypothetical protein